MRKLHALSIEAGSIEFEIDELRKKLQQTVPGIQEADIVSIQVEKMKVPIATVDENGKQGEKENLIRCFYWA